MPLEHIQKELDELSVKEHLNPIKPAHFLMNLMGLTVFPFIARPMLQSQLNISDQSFNELLDERKVMIPEIIFKSLKA